jgi:hypothetical protein
MTLSSSTGDKHPTSVTELQQCYGPETERISILRISIQAGVGSKNKVVVMEKPALSL